MALSRRLTGRAALSLWITFCSHGNRPTIRDFKTWEITIARRRQLHWLDSDWDGIPDVADPYPQDACNGRDTDGDGIPDSVEVGYPAFLNPNDGSDAATLRSIDGVSDGLTWKQAYDTGKLAALLTDLDSDGDRMTNVYEITTRPSFRRANAVLAQHTGNGVQDSAGSG